MRFHCPPWPTHLTLNRIEEKRQKVCFDKTRGEIRQAAYWLIGLFALAFVIVVMKPHAFRTQTETAVANSFAIAILAMYVLVLYDITAAMFLIKPNLPDDKGGEQDKGKSQSHTQKN